MGPTRGSYTRAAAQHTLTSIFVWVSCRTWEQRGLRWDAGLCRRRPRAGSSWLCTLRQRGGRCTDRGCDTLRTADRLCPCMTRLSLWFRGFVLGRRSFGGNSRGSARHGGRRGYWMGIMESSPGWSFARAGTTVLVPRVDVRFGFVRSRWFRSGRCGVRIGRSDSQTRRRRCRPFGGELGMPRECALES